jgi:serine/threonine protein kinase
VVEISTQDDQEDLLKEIKLMKKIGQHEHIVSILGCITRKHPVCLVVEYCKHGDLLEYLRNSRPAVSIYHHCIWFAHAFTGVVVQWLLAKKQGSKQVPNRYSAVPGTLKETEGYMPMANNSSPSTPEKPEKPPLEPDDGVVGYEKPVVLSLSSYDLLLFAKQIAQGMDYLFQKDLVHRDLACRNVLVAERNLLKISDFGLTRAIYKDAAYTQKTRGRLPLKWMSVESITDRVFTTQSDVWSFGVVLWEICTLGGFPYPTISNEDMLRKLREGYRMHRPENCSEELYSIMLRCWHPEPNRRPSFSVLVTIIDQMMDTQRANLYVDLNFDAHNQYWMSISELGDSDSDAEPEGSFQESQLQQISFGKDKASYTPYSSEMEHTLVQSGQLNGDIVAADDRENEKLNGHVPTEVHNYTSTTSV